MDTHERVRALREGGHTRRAHGIPHHGHYDVANHTWHVLVLLHCLHPDPSINLLRAALFHDVAERWTGDIPAIAKWASDILSMASNEMERRVREHLGVEIDITAEEKSWLKGCDMLELHLWCMDQLNGGNRTVEVTLNNIRGWFERKVKELPWEVLEFYSGYRWARSSDHPLPGHEP